MPRRTATMLASTLVLIALLCAGVLITVPYAEMSPGPTVNTLGDSGGEPVLQIPGRQDVPDDREPQHDDGPGHRRGLPDEHRRGGLRLARPRQRRRAARHALSEGQDGGAVDAGERRGVQPVPGERQGRGPAGAGHSGRSRGWSSPRSSRTAPPRAGCTPATSSRPWTARRSSSPTDVAKLVTKHKPGEDVVFTVVPAKDGGRRREGGQGAPTGTKQVTITTQKSEDTARSRAIVGIQAGTDHTFPFDIDIKLADVGGPSAGLMFSLGIVDKLTPGT